jgi:hypothetical protein
VTDYTKTTTFVTKDNLTTGNALKVVKGSYFDTEYDAIATAIATKYDSADLASEATAEALASNTTLLTPLRLDNVMKDNGGMVSDIQALADPGADTVLGWDDSASAAIGFTLGAGLSHAATELNLADAVAGAGLSITSSVMSVGVGTGLTANANDVSITNVAAGAAQPVVITGGTFSFDLSSITEITATGLTQAEDGYVISDNGVPKVMPYDNAGLIVLTADAAQTFALADANCLNVLTGTTERIWTIPPNVDVAFTIGSVLLMQNSGSADIVVTAGTGVILDTVNHATGSATLESDHIPPGGMAVAIKTAINTWAVSGDLEDT